LRFAVRPATRPASPCGHRPPGEPSAPRVAGSVVSSTTQDSDVAVRAPSECQAATEPRPALAPLTPDDGPSVDRVTLARALLAPPATGSPLPGGRPAMPRTVPVGLLSGTGTASPRPSSGPIAPWPYGVETAGRAEPASGSARYGGEVAASGPREVVRAGSGLALPYRAAGSTEVLTPTRVVSGPPPMASDVARLGETTDRLLLRRLRDGRSPSPAITDTPRRERRPLPGPRAGALTSRAR
jgi:hypothetical protein